MSLSVSIVMSLSSLSYFSFLWFYFQSKFVCYVKVAITKTLEKSFSLHRFIWTVYLWYQLMFFCWCLVSDLAVLQLFFWYWLVSIQCIIVDNSLLVILFACSFRERKFFHNNTKTLNIFILKLLSNLIWLKKWLENMKMFLSGSLV